MPNLFFESFVLWIAIAVGLVVVGWALAQGTTKRSFAIAGFGVGLAALALGAILVFVVDTDPKSIRRTIRAMESAAERNDADGVLQYVSKNASVTRRFVNKEMRAVRIDMVKASGVKIDELNKTTSPARARVSLRIAVQGQGRDWGEYPFSTLVEVDMVELRQEPDGVWRVTDKVELGRPFR